MIIRAADFDEKYLDALLLAKIGPRQLLEISELAKMNNMKASNELFDELLAKLNKIINSIKDLKFLSKSEFEHLC